MYIRGFENLMRIIFNSDIFDLLSSEIFPLSFSLLGYLKRWTLPRLLGSNTLFARLKKVCMQGSSFANFPPFWEAILIDLHCKCGGGGERGWRFFHRKGTVSWNSFPKRLFLYSGALKLGIVSLHNSWLPLANFSWKPFGKWLFISWIRLEIE